MECLLLTGAGGGGSNNLIRAIRALPGADRFRLVGVNADPFALSRSLADSNYLIAHSKDPAAYIDGINRACERESVDLVIPTNDTEVGVLSMRRAALNRPIHLPPKEVVETCLDKSRFGQFMTDAGVAVPRAVAIDSLSDLPAAFNELGSPETLWLRMRSGCGSRGTLPVHSAEQAEFWIRYWSDARGVSQSQWVLNEYLPGRDFAFMGIWHRGKLVAAKTAERLQYLFGNNVPSGTMSTPSVARLVANPDVQAVCVRAIAALDPKASGVFSVDLKEDADGRPNLTEINAARFFRISPIFNLSGRTNLAGIYLDVARGRQPSVNDSERFDDGAADGYYWICDIEGAPSVITKEELDARFERLA